MYRGVSVGLVGGVQGCIQLLGCLVHFFVGLDLGLLQGLFLGLRLGDALVCLGDILSKLTGFAVQCGLLGLIVSLFCLQIRLGLLQLGALLLQLGMLVLKLLANFLILADDLLQCGGKGKQLVQAGRTGEQRNGTAVIQPLHRAHTVLEIRPALVVFSLLLVDLLLLLIDLVLFVDDIIIQTADLLSQCTNLAEQQ